MQPGRIWGFHSHKLLVHLGECCEVSLRWFDLGFLLGSVELCSELFADGFKGTSSIEAEGMATQGTYVQVQKNLAQHSNGPPCCLTLG